MRCEDAYALSAAAPLSMCLTPLFKPSAFIPSVRFLEQELCAGHQSAHAETN